MPIVNTGTLHADGRLTNERQIDPGRCPHYILVADHYRPDGSCTCNDRNNPTMREWGYRWSYKEGRWVQ